jgi:hypothetical protein
MDLKTKNPIKNKILSTATVFFFELSRNISVRKHEE